MCLDKIRPDMNRFEKGWKVFKLWRGKLYPALMGDRIKSLPENKWIHYKAWSCHKGKIFSVTAGFYLQGWHIEATLKGTKNWQPAYNALEYPIRKVLCRDMHTTGRQGGNKVGVCRYIKILPEGSK